MVLGMPGGSVSCSGHDLGVMGWPHTKFYTEACGLLWILFLSLPLPPLPPAAALSLSLSLKTTPQI